MADEYHEQCCYEPAVLLESWNVPHSIYNYTEADFRPLDDVFGDKVNGFCIWSAFHIVHKYICQTIKLLHRNSLF